MWRRALTTRSEAAEIAALILAELLTAAAMDGVTFTVEQVAFVEQALSDAAQEAINRRNPVRTVTHNPSRSSSSSPSSSRSSSSSKRSS